MAIFCGAVSMYCVILRDIFYPFVSRSAGLNFRCCCLFDCIALLPASPSQTTCAIGNHLVSGAHEIHRQQWKCATNWLTTIFPRCLPPPLHLLILVYMRYSTTLLVYTGMQKDLLRYLVVIMLLFKV